MQEQRPDVTDEEDAERAAPPPAACRPARGVRSLTRSDSPLLRHARIQKLEPTDKWHAAFFHLVCANGAPFLLGMPAAFAALGWGGGMAVVVIGFAASLHAALRLVGLHEHGGQRRHRYQDLAQAVLGERLGLWATLPFQLCVNIGTCITYQVAAGQALRGACLATSSDGSGCLRLSWSILVFSAAQLPLVLLPDISSLSLVATAGAITSFGFTILATVGAVLHGREPDVSYTPQGSAGEVTFEAFSSLGAVYLVFGLTILLEIQSTLAPEAGSAVRPMVRATTLGFFALFAQVLIVGVSGFWAFGIGVDDLLVASISAPAWLVITSYVCVLINSLPGYLAFAYPSIDEAEARFMAGHWSAGAGYARPVQLLAKRLALRWAFVAATAAVAVCLPFMNSLMGLIGALGYSPLCFILPCLMWLKAERASMSRLEVVVDVAVIVLSTAVMVLAAVGSVASLVTSASSMVFFS